jgi:hypothetical protein
MRSSNLRVAVGLLTLVTACGTTPGTGGSNAGQSTGAQSQPASAAQSTAAAPSAAAPSQDTAYNQDECYANEYAPANSALSTLILLWPTIGYYVTDDASWQSTNATDQDLDVAAYRAAIELVKDLPDATGNGAPPWSEYAPEALELADLLEQAEASGTPFADGIGDRIRELASDLNSNYIAIAHAVDAMCPPEPASGETTAEITGILAIVEPPNSTEVDRLEGTTYSSFTYESTDSMDVLTAFFDGAIAETIYEVSAYYDDGDRGRRWIIYHPTSSFQWGIVIEPSSAGSGTTVSISFTGEF